MNIAIPAAAFLFFISEYWGVERNARIGIPINHVPQGNIVGLTEVTFGVSLLFLLIIA
jgi:hypothetical protein